MKRITILIMLISQISILFSQNFQLTWQHCYGGSESDLVKDIATVKNGYFITGGTGSNDGDISYYHGAGDGWLIRIDSLGNLLWEKTYGGTDLDYFNRIIAAPDNNFYLLGLSFSSDGDISYDPYPGSPDYWIVKIDSAGTILWDKIVGGNQGEELWTGSPTLDGGVVAIGWTYSNDGDVSEYYGGADTWMVKISSEGELEWDFTIGTDFIDKGQAIIQTTDGGYLAGSSSIKGNGGNITCEPISIGYSDGVLFKLDADLNIEWQQCYGSSNHDAMWELMELTDGYLFIEGVTANGGNVSGWHGEGDIWVVKIDFFGNIVWQRCLGGSLWESAKNSYKTDDGNFIIIGSTQSNDGDVSGNHSMSEYYYDIWLAKLNSEGELISQQCIGGEGSELTDFGVVKKSDNNFVIAGQTDYGPSYDVACTPHGGNGVDEDWWVFEIKDCSVYAPAVPGTPFGEDTVCTANNMQSTYTTQHAAFAYSYQWQLEPEDAGTITGDSLTGTVQWATDYEGTAAITVRSANDCGESVWSQPHFTQVYPCIGINEMAVGGITMKVYPNPAKDFVIFDVQSSMFESSVITLLDVYGNEIDRLKIKNEKTVWYTKDVNRGLYFYKIETGGEVLSGKIVVQ